MPHGGDDLSITLAALPPESRAGLARRWVSRLLADHAPAALEAAGHPALAHRLAEAAHDLDAALLCARQIEHALDQAEVASGGGQPAEKLAWDAVCEALAAARLARAPILNAADLRACGEHTQRAEQLAIAAQRGGRMTGRIVLAREPGRQAGEARRLVVS